MKTALKLLRAASLVDALLPALIPSMPRHLRQQGRIFGPPQTPAPLEEGEAPGGAGQTPEGEDAPSSTEVPSAAAAPGSSAAVPRPPGTPLPCEYAFWWMPHPTHAEHFEDDALAALIDGWAKEETR